MRMRIEYENGDTVKRELIRKMILNSYNNLSAYVLELQGKSPEEIVKEVVFDDPRIQRALERLKTAKKARIFGSPTLKYCISIKFDDDEDYINFGVCTDGYYAKYLDLNIED